MIIRKNVTPRRGAKVLLNNASVTLNPGEKVGLVGRNGAGPKANEKLKLMAIETIGDLAAAHSLSLIEHFGPNYGARLHEAAHGHDERPVVTYSEPKSLSRETTFEHDLHPRRDRGALGEIFTQLCERLAEDLERKSYVGRTVGVKVRYEDFSIATRELTLPLATGNAKAIRHTAGLCLKRVPLDRMLRPLAFRRCINLSPKVQRPMTWGPNWRYGSFCPMSAPFQPVGWQLRPPFAERWQPPTTTVHGGEMRKSLPQPMPVSIEKISILGLGGTDGPLVGLAASSVSVILAPPRTSIVTRWLPVGFKLMLSIGESGSARLQCQAPSFFS